MKKGVCLKCPVGCSECTDANTCTACDSSLVLTTLASGQVTCKCSDGNYGTENIATDTLNCSPCTSPCAKCDINGSNCTGCSSPNFLTSLNTCSNPCPSGNFGNTTDQTCQSCGADCDYCTDNTTCTTCTSPKLLSAGSCVTTCPTNSITNGANCDICNTGCAECSGTVSTCTKCQSGYFLSGSTCVTSCPSGEFGDATDPTNPVCAACDTGVCVECSNLVTCTKCPSGKFLNTTGGCSTSCISGFFEDQYSASDKFCRKCPSTCTSCNSITECLTCQTNFYKHTVTAGSDVRCLQSCPDGTYNNTSTSPRECTSCQSNCEKCTNSTNCQRCIIGMVSQPSGANDVCQASCNTGYFEEDGVCKQCSSNCDTCDNEVTCTACASGYSLNSTYCVINSSYKNCPAECEDCTTPSACTVCKVGYTLSSGACNPNCGNNIRDEFEACDDGNLHDGDGCSSSCLVEQDYYCEAIPAPNPDVCYCDPFVKSARWDNNWKAIIVEFDTKLSVNTTSLGSTPSTDYHSFCQEIIDSSLHSSLGSLTTCSLIYDADNSTTLTIEFSPDATFGNTQPSTLILQNLMTNNNCPLSIPSNYDILSIPIDSPEIVFSETSFEISECSEEFFLDIFQSKGITNRNPQSVSWNVLSVDSITTSPEKSSLDTLISTRFTNMRSMWLDDSTISSYRGKKVELQVSITNFFAKTDTKKIFLDLLDYKKILLEGIHSQYILTDDKAHTFYPVGALTICSSDDPATVHSIEKDIVII